MTPAKPVKILLVPDVIWGEDSGAVSARFSVRALKDLGYEVGVFAFPPAGNTAAGPASQEFVFFPRRRSSVVNHFIGGEVRREFERALAEFRPDHVFFAGAAIGKPYCFFDACLAGKIPYALLFYMNDYYCMRIYAGLADGPCFKCLGGNYLHGLLNNCQKGTPRLLQFAKAFLSLNRLKGALHKCHKVIGYSGDQLSLYLRHGFSPDQCVKSPVHFDKSRVSSAAPSVRGVHFVLCGQSTVEKGWHRMAEVVKLCPEARFKFVFLSEEVAAREIRKYGLLEFVEQGRIEVLTGIKEHSDLLTLLAGSRGVLVPSYYPTTGEFLLLEALGLGKPVVVFNAGAHKDIIRSGENGLAAEIGDVNGYAAHINRLVSDEALYHKLSDGARRSFEELTSSAALEASLRKAFPPPGGGAAR